jgi:hypothetical protein
MADDVRFEVLMELNMEIALCWDMSPCSLVDICERVLGVECAADPERGPSHRKIGLNGNGSDLYSGGARFETIWTPTVGVFS